MRPCPGLVPNLRIESHLFCSFILLKMRRFLTAAVALAVLSLLASACGSGTSAASGRSAAGHARRDVATAYWTVYSSLDRAAFRTTGYGRFVPCSGSGSNSLRYGIETALSATSDRPSLAQFTGTVSSSLSSAGWHLRGAGQNGAGQNIYSGSEHGIDVTLRTFADNLGPGGALTVEGPCVNAGGAASAILSAYGGSASDQYPSAEASASPIPTSFAPSG
jgi:hypothetical protein